MIKWWTDKNDELTLAVAHVEFNGDGSGCNDDFFWGLPIEITRLGWWKMDSIISANKVYILKWFT